MKRRERGKMLLVPCLCSVFATELLLILDVVTALRDQMMSTAVLAVAWLLLAVLTYFLFHRSWKRILQAALAVPLVIAAVTALCYACWSGFCGDAAYVFPDAGKNKIYGDRKVMVIVPHEDDELNVLGGVMEEYVRYGSELYGVFVTNGDFYGAAEERFSEAVALFASLGISEDHVIFLGYGDQWDPDGPHIYNAASGQVMVSHAGKTQTYGAAGYPVYREGAAYTIDNLAMDMKNVILDYRPDVIFCSDYDRHPDHKSTTLLFDKVMGELLKETLDYEPVVYKAYAYSTAYEAEPDYYAENILSTQDPFSDPCNQEPAVYRWEDRVRFPVDGSILSRSLVASGGFRSSLIHKSQDFYLVAGSVLNGDKVAWRRYTTSLCLDADVTASSGQAELLNDFMLIENNDLLDSGRMPYDGVWIPQTGDREKTVMVTLKETADIFSIVLYDHPSEEHNILNARISFDDGTVLETGPLDPGGASTSIAVDKKQVTSFSVSLLETEGDLAGLSEIEAFAEQTEQDGRFVKLMDSEGNFLYDYRTAPDGNAEIFLYIHGELPPLMENNYSIHIDSETGFAVLENDMIRINCPVGESFALNVTCDEAGVSDSIVVRNPGRMERMWSDFWQKAEELFYVYCGDFSHYDLSTYVAYEKLCYVIRHVV